jgi:hypothetical protein
MFFNGNNAIAEICMNQIAFIVANFWALLFILNNLILKFVFVFLVMKNGFLWIHIAYNKLDTYINILNLPLI